MTKPAGTIRLFVFRGIAVYLHWAWAIVAYLQLKFRSDKYVNVGWAVAEYVTLFLIVLLHEFGHALACRHVGGKADTIMLWPLGGVAFVQPPQRPGAFLWSIVAGPLVNVALLLPTIAAAYWAAHQPAGDFHVFIHAIAVINLGLLIFNLLPIYPLDGGQIFRSILWYFTGPTNSLIVASLLGMICSAAGLLISLRLGLTWLAIMAAFAAWQSWIGFQGARARLQFEKIPRHVHAACPHCGSHPPIAAIWQCTACGRPFDMIATHANCPGCNAHYETTACPACGKASPIIEWVAASPVNA